MNTRTRTIAAPVEHQVTCPDCGAPMRLRRARRSDLAGRLFYGCSMYPSCTSTHGAHPDGAPLGVPGNAATKAARIRAHAVFDQLWKGPRAVVSRGQAYAWLEQAMWLKSGQGHIGAFNEAQCDQVIAVVEEARPLLEIRTKVRHALEGKFGRAGAAKGDARRWLAGALGLGADIFVRDLDLQQCRRAMDVLSSS